MTTHRRSPRRSPPRSLRAPRGLSMVELLIGIAVGLLIAAAAASFLANNLRESRALLLESRLMQDLRTAADLITRELRRAGYWAAASEGIWQAGAGGVQQNPYTAVSPSAAASDSVSFNFSRDAFENGHVDTNEQFGFRLHNGAIEMLLGTSNWQALTDSATLTVTAFSVTPTVQEVSLDAACPRDCAPGSATCPPRISVRSLALRLSGRSATDPNVVRTVRSNVRLRNDTLAGACAV